MNGETTIAAVSTPPGSGAVALVRMSGPASLEIIRECWKGKAVGSLLPRMAYFGAIAESEGNVLDEVLLTWFKGPHSYTGEDTVEIACHGGVLVVRRVLERLYQCGAVPAEPGEFTRRAFLNGKMDLTQAEAVMDILSAQSDMALKAAQDQLGGALGRRIREQTDAVTDLLAHVEAHIDFPDEDITPDAAEVLLAQAESIGRSLESLLSTADRGRLLREGVRTVLAGAPNVGKSSLLNHLLGYERAIVSDTPGTTRDTLEETINLGGFALRLVDTAGLRESTDHIEKEGIDRTAKALEQADLVLEVVDASQPRTYALAELPGRGHHLLVLNKADLGIHTDWASSGGVPFSCRTGEGEAHLIETLTSLLTREEHISDSQSALVAINARHQHCLGEARDSMKNAAEGIKEMLSPEFVALDLREALSHLGEVTGKVDTEDVLGRIFSQFCIGK